MSDTPAPESTPTRTAEAPANTAIAARATVMPPPVPAELVSYQSAPPERKAEIDQAMTELDIDDSKTILMFGTALRWRALIIHQVRRDGRRHDSDALRHRSARRGFRLGGVRALRCRRLTHDRVST